MKLLVFATTTVLMFLGPDQLATALTCSNPCTNGAVCLPVRTCTSNPSNCSFDATCVPYIISYYNCSNGQDSVVEKKGFFHWMVSERAECNSIQDNVEWVEKERKCCWKPKPVMTTTPSVNCPSLSCPHVVCPYGREKDSNGCDTCNCHDKCKNVVCGSREVCVAGQTATCVQRRIACPAMSCRITCPHGMKVDATGCEVCGCKDVCSVVQCGPVRHCVACSGDKCPSGYTCVSNVPMPCDNSQCILKCEHGFAQNRIGCPICACAPSPCSTKVCEKGQICEIKKTVCVAPPCSPAHCVTKPPPSCMPMPCPFTCPNGFRLDHQGCAVCACLEALEMDLCQQSTTTCAPGRRCEMIASPDCQMGALCPKVPMCVLKNCSSIAVANCRVFCPTGRALDDQGCEKCHCNPSCENVRCGQYQKCMIQGDTAKCVDINTQVGCPTVSCRLYCPHGYVRDSNNCSLCQCESPSNCHEMNCIGSDLRCLVEYPNTCVPGNCPGKPFCYNTKTTQVCVHKTCRMYCSHGYDRDESGCPTCRCARPTTCNEMKCPANEICTYHQTTNCGQANCPLIPTCMAPTTTTLPTTTTTEMKMCPSRPRLSDLLNDECSKKPCRGVQKCCPSFIPNRPVCVTPLIGRSYVQNNKLSLCLAFNSIYKVLTGNNLC